MFSFQKITYEQFTNKNPNCNEKVLSGKIITSGLLQMKHIQDNLNWFVL